MAIPRGLSGHLLVTVAKPLRMKQKPTWKSECLKWYGRVLTGVKAHYCPDWDFLPVDETTREISCCTCMFSVNAIDNRKTTLIGRFITAPSVRVEVTKLADSWYHYQVIRKNGEPDRRWHSWSGQAPGLDFRIERYAGAED